MRSRLQLILEAAPRRRQSVRLLAPAILSLPLAQLIASVALVIDYAVYVEGYTTLLLDDFVRSVLQRAVATVHSIVPAASGLFSGWVRSLGLKIVQELSVCKS